MEQEYTCITKQGQWRFYASDILADAIRVALWYCYRDGEEFIKVLDRKGNTLRLCCIDRNNTISTL